MEVSLGTDIGGTNTKIGLVDGNGTILHKSTLSTLAERGFQPIFDEIMHSIADMLRWAGVRSLTVQSMGFGIPGTTDSEAGRVIFAPNLGWHNIDFLDRVRERFRVEVYVEQDTRAAAFAEYLVGEQSDVKNIICITLGTGIGCGIIIDGRIFKGAWNTAGEIGHTIVRPGGTLCKCGGRGCLEAYASGPAIARLAERNVPHYQKYLADGEQKLTARDVFAMAAAGVKEAKEIIDQTAELVGVGLVNLINLFSPEKIVLSGGISSADDGHLIDPIREFVRKNAYRILSDKVEISNSKLGENAPMIGAAMLHKSKSL